MAGCFATPARRAFGNDGLVPATDNIFGGDRLARGVRNEFNFSARLPRFGNVVSSLSKPYGGNDVDTPLFATQAIHPPEHPDLANTVSCGH
jgi:hypothetical protein